ncbi:MAG: HEAT repeat domain-containing protein [Planctomycetota bacterium]
MTRCVRFLAPLLLLGLVLAQRAPATEGDAYVPGQFDRPSTNAGGHACWPYLRSPLRRPADANCARCEEGADDKTLPRPKGASAACWGSKKKPCFWKRHAWSWGLECSQCWAEEECPSCDGAIGGRDPKVRAMLEKQLAIEGSHVRGKLWIVVSPHFYVVTNIDRKLKIPTDGGAPRLASGHEVAHLYAQRCEIAYEDFVHYYGKQVNLGKPMAVLLMRSKSEKAALATAYLGGPRTNMLYGGGSNRISGGFAGNGFVGSLQEERNDHDLHAYSRHMIGHVLFSCWIVTSGIEKQCPKWAFVGAAHFLEKLLPEHEDFATFCSNETTAPSGSPKDWDKKARALTRRAKLDPIETFFGRESMGAFSYTDHIRAWSLMDLMLREDRDRWRKVLAELRRGAEEGYAFKQGLGTTPHEFNLRWIDRLKGRRPTMGELRRDAGEDPDAPGVRERKRLTETQDADVLAGLVRGLDRIDDVRTARVVVSRLDHPSDLVRESIRLVLAATKNPDVLAYLRGEALDARSTAVRAGVVHVLGDLQMAEARKRLEALLKDHQWLVRAEAAWALGRIHDPASFPRLVEALAKERKAKTWILLADAAASYRTPSKEATLALVPMLSHRYWQVRVTAAQALAAIGTEEALDALIQRFNREGGRLYRELYAALKAVSQDDLGKKPETWKKWWDAQKEEHGGLGPQPAKRPTVDDRYGKVEKPGPGDPGYYGHRIFSKSVGFVLDTSGSMKSIIRIPQGAAQDLGGLPRQGTRMDLAKGVLIDALQKLDPRVRFNLVFFSSNVRPWKKRLLPATPGNVGAAISAVKAQPPKGETNIHGALKAALGLTEASALDSALDPIPDTVYFLTDGSPTRGEITTADELLSWFENLNRFAKVELHVIAMGNLGVDLPFLRRLAKVGGGQFIHVPEG